MVTHIRSMAIDRYIYIYNYKDSVYQMSINRLKTITILTFPCRPFKNYCISYLYLLVKSFE